jgi:hypothetical protein
MHLSFQLSPFNPFIISCDSIFTCPLLGRQGNPGIFPRCTGSRDFHPQQHSENGQVLCIGKLRFTRKPTEYIEIEMCSAQTRTGIGHLRRPPGVELIPWRRKPLRRTITLRDPAQTQVWSEQVWLDTTFISQGSRSWGKLAVETWRVKTKLIIITILHIIITTTSILNLRLKIIAPRIMAHTQCINKYWKYTQIFAAQNQAKS